MRGCCYFFFQISDKLILSVRFIIQVINFSIMIFGSFSLQMRNYKQKSIEFEQEFMEINNGNGDDTPLGFPLFEPPA